MSRDPRVKICNLYAGEDLGGKKPGLVDETDDFYIGQGVLRSMLSSLHGGFSPAHL